MTVSFWWQRSLRWRIWALAGLLPVSVAKSEGSNPVPPKLRAAAAVFRSYCLDCHSDLRQRGGLRLDVGAHALKGGDSGAVIVPGNPAESLLLQKISLPHGNEDAMPPPRVGLRLRKRSIAAVREWIESGASWPNDFALTGQDHVFKPDPLDGLELTAAIHALILEKRDGQPEEDGQLKNYRATIPKTGVSFEMVAIPGGEFLMGSAEREPHRHADEGPPVKRRVAAFWMGKHEVTWDEFNPFAESNVQRYASGRPRVFDPENGKLIDAISQPTMPYLDMTFGMGREGYPAISMTQHAASKYCQWLSVQTGQFYRLPTETEWEYACRAGTRTAYSFGNDPSDLDAHGVYWKNSYRSGENTEAYAKVGSKRPNPWGLYDMHGNVAEWTLDEYDPKGYAALSSDSAMRWSKPRSLYPRAVRGGSWFDEPEDLRSAARRGSSRSWKRQDPMLPNSIWYLTDATWLGFRIVRTPDIPSVEEMHEFWNSATGMTR